MYLPNLARLGATAATCCLITATTSQMFSTPKLEFAFTASIYDYATGPPVPYPGYTQTFAIASKSVISGPLLNATLLSLNAVEQDFNPKTGSNISYFTSQGFGLYMTDDGEAFNWQQIGYTSNTTDAFWANLGGIGGKYAYLRQYLIMCAAPLHISYDFNTTTETVTSAATSTSIAAATNTSGGKVAHAAYADCYIVGGL